MKNLGRTEMRIVMNNIILHEHERINKSLMYSKMIESG